MTNEPYLVLRNGDLTSSGVFFLLNQLKNKKDLGVNSYLSLLEIFAPSCVHQDKGKWSYGAGKGMFIVLNVLMALDNLKGSWFQEACEISFNKIPQFTPKQIQDFCDYYSKFGGDNE